MKGLIFTYLVTYGGSVVALFNPFYGLLAYVCFAIIKPESLWFWSVPAGNYSRIIAIAMLLGWAFQGFGDWRLGKAKWIVGAFAGFFAACVVSAILAPHQKVAWTFVEAVAKIFLPFLVGVTTVRSERDLRILIWVIVGSIGYVGYNENITYFQNGSVGSHNMTAHSMAVGAVLAFFLGSSTKKTWAKLLAFALAALMVHAVLFHMSRGAMIGLCVAAFFTFLVIPKTARGISVFVFALLVGLLLAGESVLVEFETVFAAEKDRDDSAQSRFDLWADMWTETKKHPITGIGPRHWPLVAEKYGWPPGKEGHGLWIQTAAEIGIAGGLLYVSFYIASAFLLWPLARSRDEAGKTAMASYARLTVVAAPTFVAEAMFGSFSLMELPYYAAMIGAVTLKFSSTMQVAGETVPVRIPTSGFHPWLLHQKRYSRN